MRTIAVNAGVIIWVSLLIFAPSLVWSAYRRPSPLVFALGGAGTLTIVSAVTYVAALSGVGSLVPLRIVAVILGVLLAWASLRIGAVLVRRQQNRHLSVDWLALPFALLLGIWAVVPPLMMVRRQNLTFGLTTIGNNDLAEYVMIAQHVGVHGFHNADHITNVDMGESARHTYVGATALLNFVQASTGLTAVQAALAAMGIAICFLVVALWALGRTIWPTAPYAVSVSLVIGCFASLTAYTFAQYFLGSVLGLASLATALAGATLLARQPGPQPFLALVAGGASGVFSYVHLGLPVLALLPAWAVLVSVIVGFRTRRQLVIVAVRGVIAVTVAFALSVITLSDAVRLVKSQSQSSAGWQLSSFPSTTAFLWPDGIITHTSRGFVVASWLAVAVAVTIGLVTAWRAGLHFSVMTAATLALACTVIVGGANLVYGTARYQTWKMESFLLPLAATIVFPAFAASATGIRRYGRAMTTAIAGAAALCPLMVWLPEQSRTGPILGNFVTSEDLMSLRTAPALSDISALNIDLPTHFEEMSAASIMSRLQVTLVGHSYYPPATSPTTCTLTTIDQLPPGDTNYIPVSGQYVLVNRPTACELKK